MVECVYFSFDNCPIYTHDDASTKFRAIVETKRITVCKLLDLCDKPDLLDPLFQLLVSVPERLDLCFQVSLS
jgi:hypothetical protein